MKVWTGLSQGPQGTCLSIFDQILPRPRHRVSEESDQKFMKFSCMPIMGVKIKLSG
jgi:hypothetical protein